MINATNNSSCRARASSALRCCGALLCIASTFAAQSRSIRAQSNSNKAAKKTASVRSSDSAEGSRVAINSTQTLNDYEAYRRGDRFYVKIPPAEVLRAETLRGRGYADVKVARAADSTVISFRLQPGTTAHVEQRGNKLEVVFNSPGGAINSAKRQATSNIGSPNRTSANKSGATGRELARASASPNSPTQPASSQTNPSGSQTRASNTRSSNSSTSVVKNTNNGDAAPPSKTDKSGSKSSSESNSAKNGLASPVAPVQVSSPTPKSAMSATPNASSQKAINKATAGPTPQITPSSTIASPENASGSWQSRLKERARYLILLAQLNPVPVVIGAAILVLLILSLMFRRRRLKGTRRARVTPHESAKTEAATPAPAAKTATVAEAATTTAGVGAAPTASAVERKPAQAVSSSTPKRIETVAEQVKNVVAGGAYDERIIGSSDLETRQLVGAELLSAMVGRNLQRRERARAAFMNHGYFDDATRDLRTAEAPVERAAAARRLSFVHDHEATPHLIGALDDPAPEVRRTAVEALMDLRDPAAIGPLNSLMQTETDRKIPRTLIKHAIDACATSTPDNGSLAEASSFAPPTAAVLPSPPIESEREVIEI